MDAPNSSDEEPLRGMTICNTTRWTCLSHQLDSTHRPAVHAVRGLGTSDRSTGGESALAVLLGADTARASLLEEQSALESELDRAAGVGDGERADVLAFAACLPPAADQAAAWWNAVHEHREHEREQLAGAEIRQHLCEFVTTSDERSDFAAHTESLYWELLCLLTEARRGCGRFGERRTY